MAKQRGGAMELGELSQLVGMAKNPTANRIVETAELKVSYTDAKMLQGRGLNPVRGTDSYDAESLQQEVTMLASEDMGKRRAALFRVQQLATSPQTPQSLLSQAWEILGLDLFKLMGDPVERCRDMAMRCLLAFLDRVTAVAHILPVAIPCLVHRVGSSPPEEASEEVRLLLLLVLSRVISLLPKQIGEYMEAVSDILGVALQDSNPSVRKEACQIISMLCSVQRDKMKAVVRYEETRVGPEARYRYGELILALKPSLRHKHASVRTVAVCALGSLLLTGDKNLEVVEELVAWQQPNIIPIWHFFSGGTWEDGRLVTPEERGVRHNYLALLAGDKSVQVREAFIMMLVDWMTRLKDRWDHEARLLPYLLNGLTDEIPHLRSVCWEAMERLGQTHEEEKNNNDRDKQELRDFREYGHRAPAEANAQERWNTCVHEPPFSRRPRLGARMVVRNNFRRLIPTLVRELNEWQDATRTKSAQLIYYLTLYCEHWVTGEVLPMVQAFVKCATRCLEEMALGDPEAKALLSQVLLCAQTVGEFVDPAAYLPLLLPSARGETEESTDRRCGALQVLSALVRGCSPSWLRPQLRVTAFALDGLAVWDSRDPRLSSSLARCARGLVEACGAHAGEEEREQLLRLLLPLQVKAWSYGAKNVGETLEGGGAGAGGMGEGGMGWRSWEGLQTECVGAVRAVAETGGKSPEEYMARKVAWVLDQVAPVCRERGLGYEMALMEVVVRVAGVAHLCEARGVERVVENVLKMMETALEESAAAAAEGGREEKEKEEGATEGGEGEEGGDEEWEVVKVGGGGGGHVTEVTSEKEGSGSVAAGGAGPASNLNADQGHVVVDGLVLLCHLLSEPETMEGCTGEVVTRLVGLTLRCASEGFRARAEGPDQVAGGKGREGWVEAGLEAAYMVLSAEGLNEKVALQKALAVTARNVCEIARGGAEAQRVLACQVAAAALALLGAAPTTNGSNDDFDSEPAVKIGRGGEGEEEGEKEEKAGGACELIALLLERVDDSSDGVRGPCLSALHVLLLLFGGEAAAARERGGEEVGRKVEEVRGVLRERAWGEEERSEEEEVREAAEGIMRLLKLEGA